MKVIFGMEGGNDDIVAFGAHCHEMDGEPERLTAGAGAKGMVAFVAALRLSEIAEKAGVIVNAGFPGLGAFAVGVRGDMAEYGGFDEAGIGVRRGR